MGHKYQIPPVKPMLGKFIWINDRQTNMRNTRSVEGLPKSKTLYE